MVPPDPSDKPSRQRRFRCAYLFASLSAMLLLYPTAESSSGAAVILYLMSSVTLAAGVYAVASTRRQGIAAAALALAQIVVAGIGVLRESRFIYVELSLFVAFYSYAILRVLGYVLRGRKVSADKILGALSVYLMLGLTWAWIYTMLALDDPGAFRGSMEGPVDFIYFSFVTLTTLGYGDVAPATARARSLCIVEAVMGVLFLAVLVSRLVAGYKPEDDEADS